MRLNLTRLCTSGAARRSALRAPSALRAAARRSFVTNMKIEPPFLYSTLVVGLLIRWRLQTTVGPSEEGVTITRLSSSDGRTYIRTDMGGLRATHRSPYLLTPLIDRPGVPGRVPRARLPDGSPRSHSRTGASHAVSGVCGPRIRLHDRASVSSLSAATAPSSVTSVGGVGVGLGGRCTLCLVDGG
jgi:hypothetical protein